MLRPQTEGVGWFRRLRSGAGHSCIHLILLLLESSIAWQWDTRTGLASEALVVGQRSEGTMGFFFYDTTFGRFSG